VTSAARSFGESEHSVQQLPQPPAASSPLLEGRGISKFFGHVTALRDVDFEVVRGEVHALAATTAPASRP
jgi:hypothetical protein